MNDIHRQRLRRVAELIETHPDQFNLTHWLGTHHEWGAFGELHLEPDSHVNEADVLLRPDFDVIDVVLDDDDAGHTCGTTGCIMGWTWAAILEDDTSSPRAVTGSSEWVDDGLAWLGLDDWWSQGHRAPIWSGSPWWTSVAGQPSARLVAEVLRAVADGLIDPIDQWEAGRMVRKMRDRLTRDGIEVQS